MGIRALVTVLAMVAVPGWASADPPTSREFRAAVLVGGYLALTGPADVGGQAVIAVKPGGRFGARLSARSYDDQLDCGVIAAGVTYEAAAARPRLVLDLFAEAGFDTSERVVVGGGVHTKLFVIGPLALAGETGVHLFMDGLDSSLAISGSLLVGLGR
ncbi:MAG: hypothetical protein KJO07_20310 [Deltaproteobacteria bacterium]|nr:hypothetical protein [Deltaproteobacteria bacterium]